MIADIDETGRRALRVPQLAWHYTAAKNVRGILDAGELRPTFSPALHWSDDCLASAHLQRVLYFTVNQITEPSIKHPLNAPLACRSKIVMEGGGGWYRFGYPAHLLFPVDALPLDVVPVETAEQILWRSGMAEYLPSHLRAVAAYQQVHYTARQELCRSGFSKAMRDWRVALKPVSLSDLSAIDSLDEDYCRWNRIWTAATHAQMATVEREYQA